MPLRLVRIKNSANWYIRGTVRGQGVFESTGTPRRAKAAAFLEKRQDELWERGVYGGTTFAAAVTAYLEAGGDDRYLTPLVERFGTRMVAAIGQGDIDDAATALYPNAKPSTRNRYVHTPMAAVLHHAHGRGDRAWMQVKRPKLPKPRLRFLVPDEAKRLVAACNDNLRPLVVFMLYTGTRISEAVALDWKHVDLSRRAAFIPDTKNEEPRSVHLPMDCFTALANLAHREGKVFAYNDRFGPRTAWETACKRAKITDLHPHDLRHTWATWMRRYGGLDLQGLVSTGAWASVDAADRYAHVDPSEAAAAAERLPSVA